MMRVTVLVVSALMVMASAGCSGSPSAPSPLPGSPVPGSDTLFLEIGCRLELDGYRCTATLADGNNAGRRDATGLATWSTSDTSIATVNSVGFVTVSRDGEVAIRAEYAGTPGFVVMQVETGGLRRYYRALSGWVRDAETDARLSGVRVEIVDGQNAGRATVTSEGAYQLYDLQPGTFTVRFSKSGYATAAQSFTLPGDRFNSLDARLAK